MRFLILILSLLMVGNVFSRDEYINDTISEGQKSNICDSLCYLRKVEYDNEDEKYYIFIKEYPGKVMLLHADFAQTGAFTCTAKFGRDVYLTVEINTSEVEMLVTGFLFDRKIDSTPLKTNNSRTIEYKELIKISEEDYYLLACSYVI